MDLYLNESGDMGFAFDKPFRKGGSSRFLTISFLLIPGHLAHLPKRIVRKIYDKRKQPAHRELKGRHLSPVEQARFADLTAGLLTRRPQIKLISATINKKTVREPIQKDIHRLFSHVSRLSLIDNIKKEPTVRLIPDNRSFRKRHSSVLTDYIQTELWFECHADTVIENDPKESPRELNLQFLDWVSHIIWKRYEDNDSKAYDILKSTIEPTPWWETLSGLS